MSTEGVALTLAEEDWALLLNYLWNDPLLRKLLKGKPETITFRLYDQLELHVQRRKLAASSPASVSEQP